jgi:hypothetical protein
LPLAEMDFFTPFYNEFNAVARLEWKELGVFLLSICTFFVPAFKSVSSISSGIRTRRLNAEVDGILQPAGHATGPVQADSKVCCMEKLLQLKHKATDFYGKGILVETHYNPLKERINMHLADYAPVPVSG